MSGIGDPSEEVTSLIDILRKAHSETVSYRSQVEWKYQQGQFEGAHEVEFDDSSWETRTLPTSWDPTLGDAWFRFRLVVPEHVSGVSVKGSKVEIVSSVLLCAAEIFVDGKLVLKEGYWTDFRGPRIVLAERAVPGDVHVIAIRAFSLLPIPKGARASIPKIALAYDVVERLAFEIDSFCEELTFAVLLPKGKELVAKVVKEFDRDVLTRGPEAIAAEVDRARTRLTPLSKYAKQFKVHLIAHAHIDMNWLWPWQDTVHVIQRDFSTIASLMDKYPDLHFSQSQAVTYKTAEDTDPQLFEKMREKVKAGNWDITAATWVEGDLNMGGTEALVRQILYAKGYIKDKFGFEPKVCWEPDTFGHTATMPQLLRRSGLDYYYFMRCGRGHPMFWWEGIDGSRVLAFNSVYGNTVTPKNVAEVARTFYEKYGLKTSMFVYGIGDHGGGPTIEDIEDTHRIQNKPTLPNVVLSSTHSFFRQVSRQGPKLPTVKGELNFVFDGCYSTHGDIKRYNRLCERLLVDAEKFSVMASVDSRLALHEAWIDTLFNQFHDILDGSAVGDTYVRSAHLAQQTIDAASKVIKDATSKVARAVRFSGDGIPIVVFNSLSWDRTDIVRAEIPKELIPKNPVALDPEGNRRTAQADGNGVLFVAEAPSLGYRTYYLVEGEPSTAILANDALELENKALKVELDRDSGAIKSLFDKANKRFVVRVQRDDNTMPVLSNLIQVLYEAPHGMSAWAIGKIAKVESLIRGAKVEVLERGPVRGMIKVTHHVGRSEVTQDVVIYEGIPRIDFRTSIDWAEVGHGGVDAPMLKVSFTPVLHDPKATFEVPFGHVVRDGDGREVPALRWIDLSDVEYGLSLLNDCKYGFDVAGSTMRMTLVRSSYEPDPSPDRGRHELLYSLYPHAGDWKRALTYRRGYEINHPLEAVVIVDDQKGQGSRPETDSVLRVSPDNVVVSCMKASEDSEDLTVRIYDATGSGAFAVLTPGFPVKSAKEVDLMERQVGRLKINRNRIRLKVRPHQIRTVKLIKTL